MGPPKTSLSPALSRVGFTSKAEINKVFGDTKESKKSDGSNGSNGSDGSDDDEFKDDDLDISNADDTPFTYRRSLSSLSSPLPVNRSSEMDFDEDDDDPENGIVFGNVGKRKKRLVITGSVVLTPSDKIDSPPRRSSDKIDSPLQFPSNKIDSPPRRVQQVINTQKSSDTLTREKGSAAAGAQSNYYSPYPDKKFDSPADKDEYMKELADIKKLLQQSSSNDKKIKKKKNRKNKKPKKKKKNTEKTSPRQKHNKILTTSLLAQQQPKLLAFLDEYCQ